VDLTQLFDSVPLIIKQLFPHPVGTVDVINKLSHTSTGRHNKSKVRLSTR